MRNRSDTNDLIHSQTKSNRKISHNPTTGSVPILCQECDSQLGEIYDIYAKEWVITANEITSGIETDTQKLAGFITSVFWRASLSNHWMYKNFLADDPKIKSLIKNATYFENQTFKISSYSVERLEDKSQGFSQEELKGIMAMPHAKYIHNGNTNRPTLLMRMAFEGFIWSMAIPRVSFAHKTKGNLLQPKKNKYVPTRKDIFSDPDLKDWILDAYRKNATGLVSKRLLKEQNEKQQ